MQKSAFKNIENLYTEIGYKKLKSATIMIVGLGGVGSWAAESLARTGVGNLILVDLDDICISNINRQIHATTMSVGKTKIEVLKERFLSINPEINITLIEDFFTESSSEEILSHNPDFVIDAFDSVPNKCHLIDQCIKKDIKIITTGGAGGLKDTSKIIITDLNKTFHNRLLHQVRRRLKRDYNFNRNKRVLYNVPCVFSPEPIIYPDGFCENATKKIKCDNGLGSNVAVTATFGFFAANYIVNELTN